MKPRKRLGSHQTRMLDSLYTLNGWISIRMDTRTKRIATSLEQRGLVHIHRTYTAWTISLT